MDDKGYQRLDGVMDDTARAAEMASKGAPPEEVERIKALMSAPTETIINPIKVVYDKRAGLGIFVGGALIEYAVVNGPYFNDFGRPRLTVTNLEDFVKAVGKQLVSEMDETGVTLLTDALDCAMLAAIESGCAGVEVGDTIEAPDANPEPGSGPL